MSTGRHAAVVGLSKGAPSPRGVRRFRTRSARGLPASRSPLLNALERSDFRRGMTQPFDLDSEQSRLMARVSRRDKDAFHAIYDAYRGVVYGIALSMLRSTSEAEDLVQEVFVEIWNRADGFDPSRGRVATWIMVLARSRTIDRVRSARWRSRERSREPEQGDFPAEDSHLRPNRRADDRMLREHVDSLPDEQREAVVLSYFSGYSASEISEITGTPTGTVKSRLRLALGKIRDALVDDSTETGS